MKNIFINSAMAAMILLISPWASAEQLSNGNFDKETVPGYYQTIGLGSSVKIAPWVVTKGNIDIVSKDLWVAHTNPNSIDLLGTDVRVGEVSQTFTTIPGNSYRVTFAMSGSPGQTKLKRIIEVMVSSSNMSSPLLFTHNPQKTETKENLRWTLHSFNFVAKDTQSTIMLAGYLEGKPSSSYGPLLDSVSVVNIGSGGGGNPDPEICLCPCPCVKSN